MGNTLSVSEARAMLPALVDRVERGEEITLTRHGRPVAVVVRPDALRARKGEGVMAAAADIHAQLETARRVARPSRKGISPKRADALVADLRSGRTRG
jgi:antitoxin (DNA-binding transcriptional repressor) of toxin-antitoxin stability system